MKRLRTIVFWMHLGVALAAGLVVVVMAVTGASLAFEKELLAWLERDDAAAAPGPSMSADAALARVVAARPKTPVTALVFQRQGGVRASLGRDGVRVSASGEVRPLPGQGWRDFLRAVNDWHRALGAQGDRRAVGRAITGAANAGFLFLGVSGLFLWWPRRWTGRARRLSFWFKRGLAAKARDWNWHNVIGFWCVPALLVITSSGMIISYRWASNLVYALAGEPPPATAAPVVVPAAGPEARPAALETLVETARREVPDWYTITLRLREPGRNPQAASLTVKQVGPWPRFANVQLSLDPFTGKVLRKESFADFTPGRRARSWLRFLHTGEALGWPGQLAAAVVSLGAVVLAWTGFALAWRRFVARRRSGNRAPAGSVISSD